MKIQRKRNRLEYFNYKGNCRYFLTICIQKDKEYFKRQKAVDLVLKYLKNSAAVFQEQVLAYCFIIVREDHGFTRACLTVGRDESNDFELAAGVA